MLKLTPSEKIVDSTDGETITVGNIIVEDGISIYFKRIIFQTDDSTKPLINIVLIHDVYSFHGDNLDLARSLAKSGNGNVVVTLVDLRGHGLSGGPRLFIDSFSDYTNDISELIAELKKVENDGHIYIAGVGIGGLIVAKMLVESSYNQKVDGGILIYPSFYKNLYLQPLKGLFNKVKVLGRLRLKQFIDKESANRKFDHQSVSLNMLAEMGISTEEINKNGYYINSKMLVITSKKLSSGPVKTFVKQVDKSLVKEIIQKKYGDYEDIIANEIYDWCKLYSKWSLD